MSERIKTRKTEWGFLLDGPIIARTGVQIYHRDSKTVLEYRPASEVFDEASIDSYVGAPVTLGHPSVPVAPSNVANFSVGTIIGRPWRDGNVLRANVVIQDASALDVISTGRARELSVGYSMDSGPSGVTEDGVKYDIMQTNIRCNHLSIVPRGRAGVAKFTDEAIRLMAVEKKDSAGGVDLQAKIDVLEAENAKLRADAQAGDTLTQEKINEIRAEIEQKVRADVAEEMSVNAFADSVGVKPAEKVIDTMRAVIAAVQPVVKLDGKSDDYVRTAFDVLKHTRGQVVAKDGANNATRVTAARVVSASQFLKQE